MINNDQNCSGSAVPCPSCRATMLRLNLDGRLQNSVALDLCFVCQGIWFDAHESAQITPGGIIDLFRLIHEHREELRQSLAGRLRCPRCRDDLQHSLDIGKSGKFNYYRCIQDHGRFTPFAQLMIEKGFVRQLSPTEIKGIAAHISTIHCNGCGAPFDIRTDAACPYCRSPIAILDPAAVEKALANYQKTEIRRKECNPLMVADALLTHPRQFSSAQNGHHPSSLIAIGMDAAWTLFNE